MTHVPQDSSYKQNAGPLFADAVGSEDVKIDLQELLYRLLENAKYLIAAAVLGAIAGVSVTLAGNVPQYTATAKLYMMSENSAELTLGDLQMSAYLAADYQEVFENRHVRDRVIQKLGLPYDARELGGMLQVSHPEKTRILHVSITGPNALETKQIADAYAEAAQIFIQETLDGGRVGIFEEALLPTRSDWAGRSMRNVLFGSLAGLMIACTILGIRFCTDDRIRYPVQIEEELGLPVLGSMPAKGKTAGRKRGFA